MVTGAYARRNSSTAVGMRSGSDARRWRSSGCCAKCHSDAPIADHVVSMPAIISSTIVPAHVIGVELVAVELGVQQERGEVVLRLGEMFLDAGVDVRVELASRSGASRSSGDASTSSSTMRMKRRKMSASSCGKPSMRTITRSGMCWA